MSSKSASVKQNSAEKVKREIPTYISCDLEYLESIFQIENKLDSTINCFFDQHPDHYIYALDLMSNTKDFNKGKSWSLSRAVMEAFKEWCSRNDFSWQLTRELKTTALRTVLRQPNGSLVGLVCDIFKLKDDSEYIMQIIDQLLKERKFREVYYTIISLNLQREFSLSKVVLPFFFLDKESWLRNYLQNFPEIQLQLVKTLDSVSVNRQNILDLVNSLNVDNVRKQAYDTSWLQKRIAHFVDIFNIDISECPNLYQSRSAGAMHYLIRKRYTEETISAEPWEELVTVIVADNPLLQKELVTRVTCLNDCQMALKLAKKFNINVNEWPASLHHWAYSNTRSPQTNWHTPWGSTYSNEKFTSYLTLRLDMSDIHFVDNPEKFMQAVADISENYDVVGVDAEWRPNLGISKERIALLQLAVWDTVYLIDILVLKDCLKKASWEFLMDSVFCNPKILKLGYGVHNDLRLLIKAFDEEKAPNYSQVIDAGEFFIKVKKLYPSVMDEEAEVASSSKTKNEDYKGLSQLCAILLGKPLNKDEQFSDWERRPLREKQILYAALDAYCLLLVYEKLYHMLKDKKLSFEELLKLPLSPKNKSPKKNQEGNLDKTEFEPSKITDFKIVTDSMLHGLGKYLRLCGADVVIVKSEEDHMDTIKIAQAENRIILTSGGPYKKLKGYVPKDMCFYVPDSMLAKDQAAYVLKHFNIQMSESDIFSRCTVCNGNHYLKVPSEDLQILWSKQASLEGNMFDAQTVKCGSNPYFTYEDGFITKNGILNTGVAIQLHYLSPKVFGRIELFFICSVCGKVYWEGSHFQRIKKSISNFVAYSENSTGNLYQALTQDSCEELLRNQPSNSAFESLCVLPVTAAKMQSETKVITSNSAFEPLCVLPVTAAKMQSETKVITSNSSPDSIDVGAINSQKPAVMQFEIDSSDSDSDGLVHFN